MPSPLEYTGERMVPELADFRTFWEHIYRYRFAARHVRNRRVLDIACGEGYGSAGLLKSGAASVIGVDVSADACRHAMRKWGIDARIGDARKIPIGDRSVDVVVSFETIEHISEPDLFVRECARVLSPEGKLIISTPNKEGYQKITPNNPYHLKELGVAEFVALLAAHFKTVRIYTQRPISTALFSPRILASEQVDRIRGIGRFCHGVRMFSCPEIVGTGNLERARQEPVSAIIRQPWWLNALANPFAIRRLSASAREIPIYLVAVATL